MNEQNFGEPLNIPNIAPMDVTIVAVNSMNGTFIDVDPLDETIVQETPIGEAVTYEDPVSINVGSSAALLNFR